MGVKGLWNLLLPIGRRISIETLEGKILAVDASIWMIQFIKAMRDTEGKVIPNAHLIGFLRRICRLLYHGIRPVIVFDGKTPQIKLREIQRRRREMRREGALISEEEQHAATVRMAKRILVAQLKDSKKRKANYDDKIDHQKSNVSNVDGAFAAGFFMEDRSSLDIVSSESQGNSQDVVDVGNDNNHLDGEGNPFDKSNSSHESMQKLPIDDTITDDYAIAYTLQQEEYGVEEDDGQQKLDGMYRDKSTTKMHEAADADLDEHDSISVDSSYSANEELSLSGERSEGDLPELSTILSLPPNQRKDIFEKAQRHRRLSARKQYLPVAADPQKYSQCQLSNFLQSSRLNQRITMMSSSLQKRGTELIGEAIASDSTRRIVFTKNMPEVNKSRASSELQALSRKSSPKLNRPQRQRMINLNEEIDGGSIDELMEMKQSRSQKQLHRRKIIESNDYEDEENDVQNIDNIYRNDDGVTEESSNQSDQHYPSKNHSMEHYHNSACNVEDCDEGGGGFVLEDSTILLAGCYKQECLKQCSALALSPKHNCESIIHNQSQIADLVKAEDDSSVQEKISLEQPMGFASVADEFNDMHSNKNGTPCGVKSKNNPITVERMSSNCRKSDIPFAFGCKDSSVTNKAVHPNPYLESLNSDDEIDWEDGINGSKVLQSPTVDGDEENGNPLVECKDSPFANETKLPNPYLESLNSDIEIECEEGMKGSGVKQRSTTEIEEIGGPLCLSSQKIGYLFLDPPASENPMEQCPFSYVPDDNSSVRSVSPQESFSTDNATTAALAQAQATASNLTNWAGRAVRRAIEEHMGKPLTDINNDVLSRMPPPNNDVDLERFHGNHLKDSFDQDASLKFLEHEDEELRLEQIRQQRDADAVTEAMKEDIVQLLLLFGIPYVNAPAEAEAQCVALEKLGLVDGIVTEDSDVFVFGGENIYRNIFDELKFVELYLARDAKMELGLSLNDFIALAMLLGSDYTSGVKGVGIVNGMEILQAFPIQDDLLEGLQKFRKWLDGLDIVENTTDFSSNHNLFHFHLKHQNARIRWISPVGFPAGDVIAAYTKPAVDKSKTRFTWGVPDVESIQAFCNNRIGWTKEEIDKIVMPIMKNKSSMRQTRLDSFLMSYNDDIKFAKVRSARLRNVMSGVKKQRVISKKGNADIMIERGKNESDKSKPIGVLNHSLPKEKASNDRKKKKAAKPRG